MVNNNYALGNKITHLLKERRMTQKELANKIGITEVTLSRYINGNGIPKSSVLINIANTLHTTPNYLLGIEEKSDFENEYKQIQELISRNTKYMTKKQKTKLVYAIFELKDLKNATSL